MRRLADLWSLDGAIAQAQDRYMTANLNESYQLTTEHPKSHYGIPVLLNRHSGDTYVAANVIKPLPNANLLTAAAFVLRHSRKLSGEDLVAARNFLRHWPDGPQL
jgi:hypothetical protein